MPPRLDSCQQSGTFSVEQVSRRTFAINNDMCAIAVGAQQDSLLVNLVFVISWPSFDGFEELPNCLVNNVRLLQVECSMSVPYL